MKKNLLISVFGFPSILLLLSFTKPAVSIRLEITTKSTQVQYAISKIQELKQSNVVIFSDVNPELTVRALIDSINLKPEAYKILSNNKTVTVTGGNSVGLMYGLLEVKNQLKAGKKRITAIEESPNLAFRAIKFNLPWDSYRRSPALQLHMETCRDINYWDSFLDMMVENRFNKLTLWNLHPFSYMVKTAKYPEGCSLSDTELADWEVFWKKLFRMAKERGIETYLINWNIFVSPEFANAHNVCDYCIKGKHFVAQGDTSAVSKDFYRESIKAVLDTYPVLTGLGITLGEGMGNMTAKERQDWILENYIGGMRMASRKAKFIYRVPLSAGTGSGGATSVEVEKLTRSALDTLTCFDGPINIELKFNWSHAFSTPHLVKVHGGKLNDVYWNPLPKNYNLAWMMRNEDFFMLRWGQTDFVRKHIATNVKPYVNGYYVGSETYIPAKDYITSLPGTTYKYAYERQWMFYKVMGRLLYNPSTPDAFFKDEFEQRFPKQGAKLFDLQAKASTVPLVIGSWQNATWDFSLYTEGFLYSTSINKKKVQRLIPLTDMADKIPMEPAYMSISDFLSTEKNVSKGKISPLHLADSVERICTQVLQSVKSVKSGNSVDLQYEVADIKAWAYLGLYFSNKLRAAVDYKSYKTSKSKQDLENAISWLKIATSNWHSLVDVTVPVYKPVELTHFCENEGESKDLKFHWSIVENEVVQELEWLTGLSFYEAKSISIKIDASQEIGFTKSISKEKNGMQKLSVTIKNNGAQAASIKNIEIRIPISAKLTENMKIAYGSSSMGQRPVLIYSLSEAQKNSYSYMYAIIQASNNEYLFAGALSWKTFIPIITFEKNEFVIRSNGEGKLLKPGESIAYESIVLSKSDNWNQLLSLFGTAITKEYAIKKVKKASFKGWATWDYYAYKFYDKDIYENMDIIKQMDPTTNLIQIDAGWYTQRGDFDKSRTDLPGGMKAIADKIKAAHMTPGIWIDGFRANTDSEVFKNHPEYFLHDNEGKVILQQRRPEGPDKDRVYLDYSHPGARAHIAECVRVITKEMGFPYLKVDFIVMGLNNEILKVNPKFKSIKPYDPSITDVERVRIGLKTIREAAGNDTYILGCSAVFGPCFGFVDGMRTGGDINPNFDAFPERSLANAGNYYLSGKVFNGDADYLVFRSAEDEDAGVSQEHVKHGGNMTLNEAQMWADFNKFYGKARLSSDKLNILRPERKALINDVFSYPPMDEMIPIDFWQHGKDKADGYELLLARNGKDIYLGIFNWSDTAKEYDLNAFGIGTINLNGRHSKVIKYTGEKSYEEIILEMLSVNG